jgi:hypothetical protein
MRLFILSFFLTFVGLGRCLSAPQIDPIRNSPVKGAVDINQDAGDLDSPRFYPHKIGIGYLAGDVLKKGESEDQFFIDYTQRFEWSFERHFWFGGMYTSKQVFGILALAELGMLMDKPFQWYSGITVGLTHFINAQDAFANLVNINQLRFTVGYDLFSYVTLNLGIGIGGVCYQGEIKFAF